MRSCRLFSVLLGISGIDLQGVFASPSGPVLRGAADKAVDGVSTSKNPRQIVAYHCTLEHNVDLILGDSFRIPKAKYAQENGLKLGAGAYLGPNITYCIKEAAGTWAERYLEDQHPHDDDYDPTEEEFQAAYRKIISKLGLPGSGEKYALGCIEATVDLTDVLEISPFNHYIEWPLANRTHKKNCRLPGENETDFLSKSCSRYKTGDSCFHRFNQSCFDEYTSRITPEYMKHYGYDTALLYIGKGHSVLDSSPNSEGVPPPRTRTHSRRRTSTPSDNGASNGVSNEASRAKDRVHQTPTEVVVYDWDTRVKNNQVPPKKVSIKTVLQHWPQVHHSPMDSSRVQLDFI